MVIKIVEVHVIDRFRMDVPSDPNKLAQFRKKLADAVYDGGSDQVLIYGGESIGGEGGYTVQIHIR